MAAYNSEISKYVGSNNFNLPSHYTNMSHRSEMKNYLTQLQDTYENREADLKVLVNNFCKTVGKNNLLCHRDRVRHKSSNSDFMTMEYETPSGLYNYAIRNKFGLENVKQVWRPCGANEPAGCVKGSADANIIGSADVTCGLRRGGYQKWSSDTPVQCDQRVSGITNYQQLTTKESADFSKFLNDSVKKEVELSERM